MVATIQNVTNEILISQLDQSDTMLVISMVNTLVLISSGMAMGTKENSLQANKNVDPIITGSGFYSTHLAHHLRLQLIKLVKWIVKEDMDIHGTADNADVNVKEDAVDILGCKHL